LMCHQRLALARSCVLAMYPPHSVVNRQQHPIQPAEKPDDHPRPGEQRIPAVDVVWGHHSPNSKGSPENRTLLSGLMRPRRAPAATASNHFPQVQPSLLQPHEQRSADTVDLLYSMVRVCWWTRRFGLTRCRCFWIVTVSPAKA